MKELELTLRLRNNRLKERRVALDLPQAQLAKLAGVPHTTINGLECMRILPTRAVITGWTGGRVTEGKPIYGQRAWTSAALKLSEFFNVTPEELFPPVVTKVKTPVVVRKLNEVELVSLAAAPRLALSGGVERDVEHKLLGEQIGRVLHTLKEREAEVLRLRFGLDGRGVHTLEEVGVVLGKSDDHRSPLSRDRVRQIEAKALRKIRHPGRSRKLKEFY